MQAYSVETDTYYPSWEALVAAEANGYVIVSVSERPKTVPYVVGPFEDHAEAKRVRVRYHNSAKRAEAPHKVHTYVRTLWKDNRKKAGGVDPQS